MCFGVETILVFALAALIRPTHIVLGFKSDEIVQKWSLRAHCSSSLKLFTVAAYCAVDSAVHGHNYPATKYPLFTDSFAPAVCCPDNKLSVFIGSVFSLPPKS